MKAFDKKWLHREVQALFANGKKTNCDGYLPIIEIKEHQQKRPGLNLYLCSGLFFFDEEYLLLQ